MIVVDENNEKYRKVTHTKWKQTLPSIEVEDAVYCEGELIKFANKKQTQEEALKNINEYLMDKGLIEKK
jgi:hypothetical protein